jgi:nanoRNase/pAp phosphatase (c-di-AMP/oligoRNAs hydrolase)
MERDVAGANDQKSGLLLIITDDTELVSTLIHIEPRGMDVKVWCPSRGENSIGPSQLESWGCKDDDATLVKGDPTKAPFYHQWSSYDPVCVVLSLKDEGRYSETRETILKNMPEAKILSLLLGAPDKVPRQFDNDRELVLSWAELLTRPIRAELRHIEAAHHVKAIRDVLENADKIALLLQPDPDPDGLASALALRILLGRNRISTPIVSFGRVTRPENIAMMRLLDLEVTTIKPEELSGFDKVVMLDTQPPHFSCAISRVDVVIDHHPITANYKVAYKDVRPSYGATSTILTEYLKAAAIGFGQRLATALLYGIKADTLHLNREVIDADLDAFVSLYPVINYNLLRRIEKPELPMRFAPILAGALKNMLCEHGILVTYLGEVEREDLIPQVADFLLQFEDVEWVVCAGLFDDAIVMSVRNVGYVKSAGDVIKRIISGWGMGGGHRTMGKVIIPLPAWKSRFGSTSAQAIRDAVLNLFVEEIT